MFISPTNPSFFMVCMYVRYPDPQCIWFRTYMTKVQINFIDPTKKIKNVMLPLINNNYNEDSLLAQNHAIPCHCLFYQIRSLTNFFLHQILIWVSSRDWGLNSLHSFRALSSHLEKNWPLLRWRHESKWAHNKIGYLNMYHIVNNTWRPNLTWKRLFFYFFCWFAA